MPLDEAYLDDLRQQAQLALVRKAAFYVDPAVVVKLIDQALRAAEAHAILVDLQRDLANCVCQGGAVGKWIG